jgi:hypothetical protein
VEIADYAGLKDFADLKNFHAQSALKSFGPALGKIAHHRR